MRKLDYRPFTKRRVYRDVLFRYTRRYNVDMYAYPTSPSGIEIYIRNRAGWLGILDTRDKFPKFDEEEIPF